MLKALFILRQKLALSEHIIMPAFSKAWVPDVLRHSSVRDNVGLDILIALLTALVTHHPSPASSTCVRAAKTSLEVPRALRTA